MHGEEREMLCLSRGCFLASCSLMTLCRIQTNCMCAESPVLKLEKKYDVYRCAQTVDDAASISTLDKEF